MESTSQLDVEFLRKLALRLFGEYVAVRIWRYPRQILAAAVSPPTPGGPRPTPGGSATIPNRS